MVDVSLLAMGLWQLQPDVTHAKLDPSHNIKGAVRDRKATWNPLSGTYKTRDGRFIILVMLDADRFEAENVEFHEKLRGSYAALAKLEPERCVLIDAAQPKEKVQDEIWKAVSERLMRRRADGIVPFTVMSCDNIPHNGRVTAEAIGGLAELVDEDLAVWVRDNVAFPNSMVDRITPATSDRERKILADEFGVEDAWPVFCEPFRQWVLEDRFTDGRPPLEKVGVQFVDDVSPWELMKIRILNGGHAVIAYPAGLMDIHFVHEAMQEPLVRAFLEKVERDEIIPVVPPVPNTSLEDYFKLIDQRFSNPRIGDTVRRLCLDGSNRQPKFIIPTIADRLKAGKSTLGLALESALWCRYCFGTTDSGAVIEPNDPNWDRMQATAAKAKDDPAAWLAMEDIYGEVGRSPAFVEAFSHALRILWAHGARETLTRYLAGRL